MMYEFLTEEGLTFSTPYGPRQISMMYCFDAFDREGDRFVMLTADVNFKTFKWFGDPNS